MPGRRSDSEVIEFVEQAHYKILEEGLSLSRTAEELGVDRKILRKYIENYLTIDSQEKKLLEDEIRKLLERINNNTRRNGDGTSRIGKKRKSIKTQEYQEGLRLLAQKGVTPEEIDSIYDRLQGNRHTRNGKRYINQKIARIYSFF